MREALSAQRLDVPPGAGKKAIQTGSAGVEKGESRKGGELLMMRRTWMLGVLSAITLAGIPGAWRDGPAPEAASPSPGEDAGPTITIQTFQFRPSALEIRAGTKVTWINQDEITHTVTSGTPENRNGRFDSPLEGKGAAFSTILDRPGTYTYFCNRHQSMRGEIHVR